MSSLGPWPLRLVWAAVLVLVAPAVGDALDDASAPVQLVATVGLYALWAAGAVATLVPSTVSLTVVRTLVPGALAVAVAAAVHGPRGVDDVLALTTALLATIVALLPATVDRLVDGSSYGPERRFALAAPAPLRYVAAPLAWALAILLPSAVALLLAARAWLPGVVLALPAGAVLRLAVPALHRLSRRWVVFVPAGFVVHDPVALSEPVLFRRATVVRLGLAVVGDDAPALDLGRGTPGLVLEVQLDTPADLALPPSRPTGDRTPRIVHADRIRFSALRPGALLAEATARRLPVG